MNDVIKPKLKFDDPYNTIVDEEKDPPKKFQNNYYLNRGTKEDSCKQSLQLFGQQTNYSHTHRNSKPSNCEIKRKCKQSLKLFSVDKQTIHRKFHQIE